ncbi:hypothetical protein ACA910_015854 [Epithemia clementina (nom. ined.)]
MNHNTNSKITTNNDERKNDSTPPPPACDISEPVPIAPPPDFNGLEKKQSKVERAESPMETLEDGSDDNNNDDVDNDDGQNEDCEAVQDEEPNKLSIGARTCQFYLSNEFLILVLAAIALARAYPPLGADYLAPEITATWIAVCYIFVYAGLGLKTDEFSKACNQIWFNLFVQVYNFGFVSAVVYAGTRGLVAANILSQDLADGMVVTACLPMAINLILVLTEAAGGDESLAIINAAAGNMIGVFLSPLLILGYLGVTGDIQLTDVFYKLALRVVLPVAVGQVMQKTMPKVAAFYKKYKLYFKKGQEYALVFIVYTVFCTTFEGGSSSSIGDVFAMIAFVFLFLIGFMAIAWAALAILFKDHPEMRVMGLFGCSQKTVAMGVPLINAFYEGDSNIGLYTLPLLIWHPMQLIVGTFLAPRLVKFVEHEKIRLLRQQEADLSTTSSLSKKDMKRDEPRSSNDLESSHHLTDHSTKTEEMKDEPSERSSKN